MDEEKIILGRIDDYIDKAIRINRPVYTEFLNPNQQSQVINILSKSKDINFVGFGGYELAERRVFAINSVFSYMEPDFLSIKVLKIEFDKFNEKWVEHRSILGSIIGLGYDRKMIGDILIDGFTAFVFLVDTAADYAMDNLVSVGRASVICSVLDVAELDIKQRKGEIKRKTVSGLRIDAVLAAALNLSRGKASELLSSDLVFVNFRLINKSTYILNEGDVISIRKKGRVILKSIGQKSAKDRTWIEFECLF